MSSARSRSSRDTAPDDALPAGTRAVLAAVRASGAPAPVVLIDGRSGAGKSTLARALVASWPAPGGVQLVALDSIYPGWDGLAAGAEIARRDVLVPHDRGTTGRWRRHDWERDAPAEEHEVDPSRALIVEGAGVLTRRSRRLCDVAVWVEAPDDARRRRALDRDGEAYRPHWARWARQETAHIDAEHPRELADVEVTVP